MKNKIKKSIQLLGMLLFLTIISYENDSITESEIHDHSHRKSPNEVSFDFFRKTTKINDVNLFLKGKMRLEVFESIEIWYNRKRRYSALNYATIEEFNNQINYNNVA